MLLPLSSLKSLFHCTERLLNVLSTSKVYSNLHGIYWLADHLPCCGLDPQKAGALQAQQSWCLERKLVC